ncbi:hypothetical protein C8Q79DRAFT_957473 [Trametes meyenii]|nr:hypothetical protein C8Q79DRAFT_957473 [Trametes meyenii]
MANDTDPRACHPFPPPDVLPRAFYVRSSSHPETTLQAMMGLVNDLETFTDYMNKMYHSAEAHLVPNLHLRDQASRHIDQYIKKASKYIPSLDQYEGAWPAICYGRHWCRLQRTTHRRGRQRQAKQHVGRSPVATGPPRPTQGRRWIMTSVTITSRPSLPISQAGCPQAEPTTNRHMVSTSPLQASSRTAGSSASDVRAVAPVGPGAPHLESGNTAPVRQFLRSLTQPLECLLPLLVAIGVQDGESLLGLARMTDRFEWLEKKLVMGKAQITPLQLKHLEDGLTEMLKTRENAQ